MKEFSLLGFVEHLGAMTVAVAASEREGLEAAALLVEKEAKGEIGEYQDGSGKFGPWPELADYTKDERVNLGFSENEPGLRSGDMRASIEHTVSTPAIGTAEASIGSNDDHLVYFELGTDTQPPRSVLGLAADRKAGEVVDILGGFVVKALVGEAVAGGRLSIP